MRFLIKIFLLAIELQLRLVKFACGEFDVAVFLAKNHQLASLHYYINIVGNAKANVI